MGKRRRQAQLLCSGYQPIFKRLRQRPVNIWGRAGKDVKVRFPKLFVATYMKCNGGSPNTSKALGNPFREPIAAANSLPVLQQAARKSKLRAGSIASVIGAAADAGGAKLGKVNEVVVTAWLDGSKELPTAGDRGFRYLVLALEPWLDHGSGAKIRSSSIPGTNCLAQARVRLTWAYSTNSFTPGTT